MRIFLATHGFTHPGGSETYVLTVAEQLQRLGHDVGIFATETGPFSEFVRDRGLVVRSSLDALEEGWDVGIVQDSILSYRIADRSPRTPQVFRAASDLYDVQLPPGLPGIVGAVVVCSDRTARRAGALATSPTVHRLRQPVDTERFMPAGAPAATPTKAVLLGNYLRGDRLEMIRSALERMGVSSEHVGLHGKLSHRPEHAIWASDIVVAKGRAALEGMACGRPVFVYDQFGGDGWVTPERYPAMEADNFAGLSGPPLATAEQLDEELSHYDAAMGTVNRELAITYHGARAHTQELCALLETVNPPVSLDGAPLRELSRLVDLQWRSELRASGFEAASRHSREYAERLATELEALRALTDTRRVRFGLWLGRAADRARWRGRSAA